MKKNRAFSLIEVLIALGIIALAASLVVPVVQGSRDKSSYKVSMVNLKEVANAMEKHYLEKGIYPIFKDWNEVSAQNSPLLEYINEIPKTDPWSRAYKVVNSTETDYELQGFSAPGKLAEDLPDFTVSTNGKFKQKGKN